MQPELFEHFAADNHNCFLTDCCITLIDKTDGSDATRRVLEKGFENCSSLWVKHLKLMVTTACFLHIFPWQESSLCKMYTLKIILVCYVKNVIFLFWAVQ